MKLSNGHVVPSHGERLPIPVTGKSYLATVLVTLQFIETVSTLNSRKVIMSEIIDTLNQQ